MKDSLKKLAERLLRPGLAGVCDRVSRVESVIGSGGDAGIWRGRLASGRASDSRGRVDRPLSEKYREELQYWVNAKRHPERVGLDDFDRVFRDWQGIRLAELRAFVGADSEAAFEDWCSGQAVVEIGSGPYPCVARTRWRRAVAVDPLADGYQLEGLPPDDVHMRAVHFVAAPGERLPLPSGTADLVICENMLDHVSDPLAVSLEVRRVLRRGGLLWLLVDLMEYADRMHPHSMTEPKLRALLAEAGFEAVREEVREHHSHPRAFGEYRGLLVRPGAAPSLCERATEVHIARSDTSEKAGSAAGSDG